MRAISICFVLSLVLCGCSANDESPEIDAVTTFSHRSDADRPIRDQDMGHRDRTDMAMDEDSGSREPSCDDGIQNGNETGVDCGGDCPVCGAVCPQDQDCSQTECGPDPVCAMECGVCSGALPICAQGTCVAAPSGEFPGDLPASQVIAYWSADAMNAADGSTVSQWPDLTGKGYDFIAPANRQPTYRASGFNGRPTLEFDGVDDALVLDDIGQRYEEPYVIYLVFQMLEFNQAHAIMSKSPASDIDAKLVFGVSRDQYVVRNCDAVTIAGHFYGGSADVMPHLARKDHESDDRLFIDDMANPVISYNDNTTTSGPCGSGNKNPFYAAILGIRENFERGAHMNLSAVYVVDAPTPAQKSSIEADLKATWGL